MLLAIKLFPSPRIAIITDCLLLNATIDAQGNLKFFVVDNKIYDASGGERELMFKNTGNASHVDLSQLPAGIYICSYLNENQLLAKQKVVIIMK